MPKYIGWLTGFGLCVALYPNAYQDSNVGRWAIGWIGITLLLWWRKDIRPPRLGLAFLALAALSLCWSMIVFDGVWEFMHWYLLAGCFIIGASGLAEPIFEGAIWGISVNSALVILQMCGVHPVMEVTSPAGLWGNRDFGAEAAFLVAIPLIVQKRWKMLSLILPALLLPQSRAVLAVGAGLILLGTWGRIPKWMTLTGVLTGAAAAVLITYSKHLGSDEFRLAIWSSTWHGVNWFGHGVGQFYSTFPQFGGSVALQESRPEHVHNDWLEILYEYGPLGFILAAAFALELAGCNRDRAMQYTWIGFCGLCFFSFALHNAATSILGFLAGGSLYGSGPMVLDRVGKPAMADIARRSFRGYGRNRGKAVQV